MQAVPVVLKVAGVVMGAKAAIEGVKERNFMKTVIGAVSAYFGIQGLASSGAAAITDQAANEAAKAATIEASSSGAASIADTAATAATEIGKSAGEGIIDLGANAAAEAAGSAAVDVAANEALSGLAADAATSAISGTAAADTLDSSPTGIIDKLETGMPTTTDTMGSVVPKERGFISGAHQYLKDNPMIAQAGLNLAGGYMQGAAEEELLDKQEKLYMERMERMGTPGDASMASSIGWDPETRRFKSRTR